MRKPFHPVEIFYEGGAMNCRHYAVWPKRLPKALPVPEVSLFDLLETSARRYPSKTAIVYYGSEISYASFLDEANRLAAALTAAGLRPGDRVALYMQNSPHYMIGFFGVIRAGGVVVPMNPMLKGGEFKGLLADCGAQTLMTTADLYASIASAVQESRLPRVIVGSYRDYLPQTPTLPVPAFMNESQESIRNVVSWRDFLQSGTRPLEAPPKPDAICMIPYTAGSTGIPKGCIHTHRTVISNVMGSVYWASLTPAAVSLSALPFFHVTGFIHSFMAPVAAGATSVVLTRWDREAALQAIEKYQVSFWANITTMLIDLMSAPDIQSRNLSSLTFVGGGGAPLPPVIGEKLLHLTGLSFAEGYGLTETISQTHWNPPDRPKLGSIGIPVFSVDSRILDISTGMEAPVGQPGEIITRGPQVFQGYWNKPKETDEAFIDLDGERFFRTGDIAFQDEEGYFFIVDRLKRMINAAGFKVWPSEVEAILYRHPAVLEACVIGVPDPTRVETVKAIVVLKPEYRGKLSEQELIQWSKEQMSAYKYPRSIVFTESLPKSGAGKILWRQLQEAEKEKLAGQ
jgi:fatty-acyl-CoA synthase